jgi:hypothetical protein
MGVGRGSPRTYESFVADSASAGQGTLFRLNNEIPRLLSKTLSGTARLLLWRLNLYRNFLILLVPQEGTIVVSLNVSICRKDH